MTHADLKPENVLLESPASSKLKIIDFGSALHRTEAATNWSCYIQSRFYRAPEVMLGVGMVTAHDQVGAMDMWSLGCLAAELYLGLPLLPGTSEFNMMARIVELVGYVTACIAPPLTD